MKKILLSFIILLIVGSLFAEVSDNDVRNFVKTSIPSVYANIKVRSIDKYGSDNVMVLYNITEQSRSFMNVLMMFGAPDATLVTIFIDAVSDWSFDKETLATNISLIQLKVNTIAKTINIDWVMLVDVDWTMMEYTINNQLKAKESIDG